MSVVELETGSPLGADVSVPVSILAPPPGRRRRGGRAGALLALARPLQWTKNLLIVPLALATAPQWSLATVIGTVWSMLVFTLAAAVVYVANDIVDRHRDRAHPQKRHRSVAAGEVRVAVAGVFCAGLAATLIAAMTCGPSLPYWPVATYLVLNVAYSRGLKHRPLIDVGIVASGFVLRMAQGTLAAGAHLSTWLLLAVFSLCLLLILGKRRAELLVAGTTHRPALRGYTVVLIDQLLQLCGGLTVVGGLLYLHADAGLGGYAPAATLLCLPFLLFGLSRYLQALLLQHSGGDPVRLLVTDHSLRTAAAIWATLVIIIVVLARAPALANQLMP